MCRIVSRQLLMMMVQERAVPIGQGMLQCPMCKTKKCTSHETMAAHFLRRHGARVDKWIAKRNGQHL